MSMVITTVGDQSLKQSDKPPETVGIPTPISDRFQWHSDAWARQGRSLNILQLAGASRETPFYSVTVRNYFGPRLLVNSTRPPLDLRSCSVLIMCLPAFHQCRLGTTDYLRLSGRNANVERDPVLRSGAWRLSPKRRGKSQIRRDRKPLFDTTYGVKIVLLG